MSWNGAILFVALNCLLLVWGKLDFPSIVVMACLLVFVVAVLAIDWWLERRGARMGGDDLDAAPDPYSPTPAAIVRAHQDKVRKNADGTPEPNP